jgi:hypothetical protein
MPCPLTLNAEGVCYRREGARGRREAKKTETSGAGV